LISLNVFNKNRSEDISAKHHYNQNKGTIDPIKPFKPILNYRRSSINAEPSLEDLSHATGESIDNEIILRKHKRRKINYERRRWLKM